ncbi:MAG: hypothetical protein Tsb0021_09380 [Chlamydiales bacterium]
MSEGKIPDFASFNELEFDIPSVPSEEYHSSGKNLTRLFDRLCLYVKDPLDVSQFDTTSCFHPGNCGMGGRAKEIAKGKYHEARHSSELIKLKYGDAANCLATVPGQYGVGFWSKHPIKSVQVISKLKWNQFNRGVNLHVYHDPTGESIHETIPLFDKCCLVIRVEIYGHSVYFVNFHAIPAYDFGNPHTPAIARNGDQLAFLEWLLRGETYFKVPKLLRDDHGNLLKPFAVKDRVIAMGDFNCDIWQETPGSMSLRRLRLCANTEIFPKKTPTTEGKRGGETVPLQLDYILARGVNMDTQHAKVGDLNTLSDHKPLLVELLINE